MSTAPVTELTPPRFETLQPRLLAGLVERYDCQASGGIPNQWQRFTPYLGAIPRQVGLTTYGVKFNFDGESSFDYLCGVEVAGSADLPQGFTSLQLHEQRYAVFTHRGHVAGVRSTFAAIWSKWFPESGHTPADAPTFERYGPEFNPMSGLWAASRFGCPFNEIRTMAKRKTRRSNLCPLTTSKTKRRAADTLAATVQENFPPGMSQPALRALAAAGLSSIGQFSRIREADLAKLHGIGPKAIKILRAELQRRGHSFRA